MNRRIALFFLLASLAAATNAGAQLYRKGSIVKTTGDSLQCMVLIQATYTDHIHYKLDLNMPEDSLHVGDIRLIRTKDQYFETVNLGNTKRIVQLSIPGKDSLFYYISILYGEKKYTNNTGPGAIVSTQGSNMEMIYILKKNGQSSEIKKIGFKEQLRDLLADCPYIIERINEDRTRYQDLPSLIEEYNRCNN